MTESNSQESRIGTIERTMAIKVIAGFQLVTGLLRLASGFMCISSDLI